ncbi:2TM domain-containing protein [Vibrio sp. LaRot3]|uniref:2TM domain-containing protein n=1 Tax=Vibrio sp. LaRot3 TaxID=2998829 RepID=UPI0022CDC551|nr:2TM domain-containing protein [Vibrio sp. LaRot3]MDA0148427.1 2TM domain-containing protein [Vibrio sp. LaRot3]
MEQTMHAPNQQEKVVAQVKKIKEFYNHLTKYLSVISLLFVINFVTGTEELWAIYPALGWGIFMVSHAINAFEVFNFLGDDWEQKEVEKRLKKTRK